MSLKTVHSKDYQNLLDNVIENELLFEPKTNAELWVKMGEELEIEKIPKYQISTIIRKDIEDKLFEKQKDVPREECKYHSGYFFEIMNNHEWINPSMIRRGKFGPPQDQKIVPHNNSEMKAICYDVINLCRILIDKSKDGTPFEDTFGEKQMSEFYKQSHTMINNCKDAIDSKTKVPRDTEIFLLSYLSTVIGNVNKCAELFMRNNLSLLEQQGKFLTTKQASKFQKGMKQSQQFILKPVDRDTAIYEGYTGIQCTCNSWRVRPTQNMNGLECYDCSNIIKGVYIAKCESCHTPLYKKRLLHIVTTGKCKNCNELVDLPDTLIEYAKS